MTNLTKGENFIWENARLLERAIYLFHFYAAPGTRILEILKTYQNEDGGFGQALEPDLRTPESQPLFVEFALSTLYACKLRDPGMANKACDYLSQQADLARGIPAILPSSRNYPRAAHWENPVWEQPSMDRLTGLVGLANWQGIRHPWLEKAVEICESSIATTRHTDAHTIQSAFCLLESRTHQKKTSGLYRKLAQELYEADFFCWDAPVRGYGLTPLDFAPTPDAYCRRIFSDSQIEGHLDDLASRQEADGGWPISWDPPGNTAMWEWRSRRTLNALYVLRSYGRI